MKIFVGIDRMPVYGWFVLLTLVLTVGCSNMRVTTSPSLTPAGLQKMKKVAVVIGSGNQGASSSDTFGDLLALELLGAGVDVVERKELDKVTSEQALSLSGVTEADKAVALGKILAVDAIVIGNVEYGQEVSSGYIMGIGAGTKQGVRNAMVKIVDVERGNLIMAMANSYSKVMSMPDAAREFAETFRKKREEK